MPHIVDRLMGKDKHKAKDQDEKPVQDKKKYLEPDFVELQAAEFCLRNVPPPAKCNKVPGDCGEWRMDEPPYRGFEGTITSGIDEGGPAGVTKVVTSEKCELSCMRSNLPIMADSCNIEGKEGVYYEVVIRKMEGIIAIGNPNDFIHHTPLLTWLAVGSACLPYPGWRFPGWHRLSVGLHLDDFMIYSGDPSRSEPCEQNSPSSLKIRTGDTIGFGYKFESKGAFFTHKGKILRELSTEYHYPREKHDLYATIGMLGANDFEVNFGTRHFEWKEGNNQAWKVGRGGVGMVGSSSRDRRDTILPRDSIDSESPPPWTPLLRTAPSVPLNLRQDFNLPSYEE